MDLIIGLILFGILMGFICSSLAKRKGHGKNWFWAGFFLGFIGLIWVGFLPCQKRADEAVGSYRAGVGEIIGARRDLLWLLVGLAAAWMLWKYSDPFVDLRRVRMETLPLQAEKKRLEKENPRLERSIAEMQTEAGRRQQAHRYGWIQPGERRIVFLEPPQEVKETPRPPGKGPSLFSRLRAWTRAKAQRLTGQP